MNIALIIGNMTTGGTQRQIINLAYGLARRGHGVTLVTVFAGGILTDGAESCPGLTILPLNKKRATHPLGRLLQLLVSPWQLRRHLNRQRPDTVYGMLQLGNMLSWIATRGTAGKRLVWGYRASNMRLSWKLALLEWVCKRVSRSVPLMIANSEVGLQCAIFRGYNVRKAIVVPNGIDTKAFRPCGKKAVELRKTIGVGLGAPLVGIVGRLDRMKGYDVFLYAATRVMELHPNCRFLCVGDGPERNRKEWLALAKRLGLSDKVVWLERCADMAAAYSALDVLVSSSRYGEGFSNVIAEAMGCGTPCVVTEVGDSARIVGDLGVVVRVDDAAQLAKAVHEILISRHRYDPRRLRERIESTFGVARMVEATETALAGLGRDG